MSRIGKKPILIPEGVEVKIDGQKITIKGLKGELQKEIPSGIKVEIKEGQIFVLPQSENIKNKALWGTIRAIVFNMVQGVTEGFEKRLEIKGLGFRVFQEDENLVLNVGFTLPIKIKALPNIKFSVEKNIITVSGPDKELVGQIAAKIRKIRPPEPYKGTGIKYVGEIIRRKEGKKAVTTSG